MNKSALRNFATEARIELLERVELQARKIGITKEKIEEATLESSDAIFINEQPLTDVERNQRNKLISRIEEIGFDRVMEETAYTWFNRFIALRFMEVNDYLPTRVRVLSSENEDSTEPDMITEALSLDLDIDRDYVYNLKMDNKVDELFKYLILLHCNDLNRYMPFMFETIEDYTAILFPERLLGTDSFIREMTDTKVIPEDHWEQIEIIGWLYQFYIAEEKDRVFKARRRYKAEEIPFATQLFTPDWIVQYMVQNSLGRYWVEAHPEHEDLKDNWEFFIEHQQEDFQEKIEPYINKDLNVEEIKCLDPAMGSGHILVYMFDVLFEIYSKNGYMEREIPRLIIENNLYGLDIDDRAYQLACFSVVMKAMEYNRRFLRSVERDGLQLNLAAIQETNTLTDLDIAYIANEESGDTFEQVKKFVEQYQHAKSIGSLIKVGQGDTEFVSERLEQIKSTPAEELLDVEHRELALNILSQIIKQTEVLEQQYDVVVTNPPYMGLRHMNKVLSNYLNEYYSNSSADLFASFMEVDHLTKKGGFYAAINQHSWMFLSTFEKLRKGIIHNKTIDTMLHLGPRAFEEIGGEVVQSTTFVLRNQIIHDISGEYIRLVDKNHSKQKREAAKEAIIDSTIPHRYSFSQKNYTKIPGGSIAYWVGAEVVKSIFEKNVFFRDFTHAFQGMITGNNAEYLRYWFEPSIQNLAINYSEINSVEESDKQWIPYNKGGGFRKWYGNNNHVLLWKDNGKHLTRARTNNKSYYLREGITWSFLSSSDFSARYFGKGFLWDVAGSSLFTIDQKYSLEEILAFMNSNLSEYILTMYNPTLNFQVENIIDLPYIQSKPYRNKINKFVKTNINLTKVDWDSFETSWDFKKHPLLKFPSNTVESSFNEWERFAESQFNQLKENEEELNRIFIDIYGLQDELTPDVEDKDVTVRKADLERDVKSFISYAVGCMLGRYSLDEEGLVYAGGEFEPDRYQTFPADENNILPILPGAYFEDDIVNQFIRFVEVTYGTDTLEENLTFIAEALNKRKNETSRERIRRYFLTPSQFYTDHIRTYKRTPIYWMFTSGRERAFNCLIYMHRYDRTTLSRIRTDYLHEVQTRYESEKQDLQAIIDGDSTAKEVRDARRELKSVDRKLDELKEYDEKLHHLADMQIEFDLDDGVRENYKKFDGLLTPIR